jgi:hypothetical protein
MREHAGMGFQIGHDNAEYRGDGLQMPSISGKSATTISTFATHGSS